MRRRNFIEPPPGVMIGHDLDHDRLTCVERLSHHRFQPVRGSLLKSPSMVSTKSGGGRTQPGWTT